MALATSHGSWGHWGFTSWRVWFYDAILNVWTGGRRRALREATLREAAIGQGEWVLDGGCGTGDLVLGAAEAGAGRVVGVDPSEDMLAAARSKCQGWASSGVVEFKLGALQELPSGVQDGSFDVVLISLVMHHLQPEARDAALREIARVLKPGGRVVVVELDHRMEESTSWLGVIMTRIARLFHSHSHDHGHNHSHGAHGHGHGEDESEIHRAASALSHAGFQRVETGMFLSAFGFVKGVRGG